MHAEVVEYLRCPVCASSLSATGTALRCDAGHSFDVARQGYVNLLTGQVPAGAETPEMISARAAFLGAGHYDFIAAAVADAAGAYSSGLVVDAGAGTGHYLAALLRRRPEGFGLAIDVAKAAARVAARSHPRADAAVADVWRGLPLADGCAEVILNIFAPRNGAEFARVLRPGGRLLVVTPRPDHLGELVATLGLLGVDPDKQRRVDVALGGRLRLDRSDEYVRKLRLTRSEVAQLVAMGPSSWHVDRPELSRRLADLGEPVIVTASIQLSVFHIAPRLGG
jgi:23S rRNA (guanine745-N1)-methyltransferase